MGDSLDVRPVATRRELERFIRLPWRLYGPESPWVPPLLSAMRKTLDPQRNPFFEHAQATLYLAWRARRPVGRIAAIANYLHNTYHGETTGFWGFFEAERDPDAAHALLAAAAADLKDRGMTQMRGPFSPSINAECGMLVDGFHLPPAVLMPYNPAYYPELVQNAGHRKLKDLVAYHIAQTHTGPENAAVQKLQRLAKAIRRKNPDVSIRSLNLANFHHEAKALNDLFNTVRRDNWGFVPVTDAEFEDTARDLKSIINPNYVFLVEDDGKLVACTLAIPDINPILKKCNGRLLPFGWLRFLLGRRTIRHFRVFGLATLPAYRNRGITVLLLDHCVREGTRRGYQSAELSWIAEDNLASLNTIEHAFSLTPCKRYRVYTADL